MMANLPVCSGLDRIVEELKSSNDLEEKVIDHIDIMCDVARGKIWWVTDKVCTAASYFIMKFRELRKTVDSITVQYSKLSIDYEITTEEGERRVRELNARIDKVEHGYNTELLNKSNVIAMCSEQIRELDDAVFFKNKEIANLQNALKLATGKLSQYRERINNLLAYTSEINKELANDDAAQEG